MRTESDRVKRAKGGHNTLSKAWKKAAKRRRGKIRRRADKHATRD